MVVPPPPLPPPPFMEPPGYFLPHPHMQPVDYRRLLQSHVHTQGGSHQNPNQIRRIRPHHTIPVRGTMNSEVQTEPMQSSTSVDDGGWRAPSSDSGRGTTSNSPCSPGSISPKRPSVEAVSYKSPDGDAKDGQVDEPFPTQHGFDKCPAAVEPSVRATQMDKGVDGQESPCRDSHMWVSTPDGMVPLCSSSQKDRGLKERRISVPDILMRWGDEAPPAMLKVTDEQLLDEHRPSDETEAEKHKSVYQSTTKDASDGPILFKILRLPCAFIGPFSGSKGDADLAESTCRDELQYSPNSSQKFPENVPGSDPHDDMTEIFPHKIHSSGSQLRRLNESVWSVESLAPFIPTRDWLLQNGMFETKVNETIEEDEDVTDVGLSTQNDKVITAGCQDRSRTLSASDSLLLAGSWLDFQTSDEKQRPPQQPEMESDDPEIQGPEKDTLSSPTPLENNASPSAGEEKGSSEPEAPQSPNQESYVNELPEKSSSPEEETLLLNSAAEEIIQPPSQNGVDKGLLTVRMAQLSPSRGNLVDCGVQCEAAQEHKCSCKLLSSSTEQNGKQSFKHSDLKKVNDKSEGFCVNGNHQKRRNGQWRGRAQERHGGQQEVQNGHFKQGKSKGGNGRNPRY